VRTYDVKQARLDPAFLEKQKKKLQALRTQILSARQGETGEESGANAEVQAQAHEAEDDAQRLSELELEGNLAAFADTRLDDIERALQKIDAGTYGVSESSGTPIPIERLEAYPEARDTLEEQKSRDARG
jgi:DnaK suppressor protein